MSAPSQSAPSTIRLHPGLRNIAPQAGHPPCGRHRPHVSQKSRAASIAASSIGSMSQALIGSGGSAGSSSRGSHGSR
jgi:hypothetical protein